MTRLMRVHASSSAAGKSSIPAGMASNCKSAETMAARSSTRSRKVLLTKTWKRRSSVIVSVKSDALSGGAERLAQAGLEVARGEAELLARLGVAGPVGDAG